MAFSGQEIREQEESIDREEQESRLKQMRQLEKLIEQYNKEGIKDEVDQAIEETKEEVNYEGQSKRRLIEEVLALVQKMQQQHTDSLEMPCSEVIEACFEAYGLHLEDLEKRDIHSLKRRIGELKGMQSNMARDLREADAIKTSLLQDREQDLIANNHNYQNNAGPRGAGGIRHRVEHSKNLLQSHKE